MKKLLASVIAGAMLTGFATLAAAENKIGFVNTERVFRDSAPAVKALKKIEKEFEKRDQELQKMAKQIQSMQESVEKNAVTMSENDRRNKNRELADLSREFQRRQREFREDLNQRRNEELSTVLERANKAIKAIAEAVDLPMVLYNVPGRSVADMAHETVLRLAQVPGIVGIKEATGNLERGQWLIRDVPTGFAVYSGDDPTANTLIFGGG